MNACLKSFVLAGLLALSGVSGAVDKVTIPEGTEVRLRLLDKLVSGTATEGARFNLELEEEIKVGERVAVPAGTKAVGTVVSSKKKGFMGKGGELNVMIDYLITNDQRIRLRAVKSGEGNDKVGSAVVLTVLFGPLGLLKRGHNVEMNPGTVIQAYVDQSTELAL